METLTTILHEMRNERKINYDTAVTGDEAATEPGHRKHKNKEVPSLGDGLKGHMHIEMQFRL